MTSHYTRFCSLIYSYEHSHVLVYIHQQRDILKIFDHADMLATEQSTSLMIHCQNQLILMRKIKGMLILVPAHCWLEQFGRVNGAMQIINIQQFSHCRTREGSQALEQTQRVGDYAVTLIIIQCAIRASKAKECLVHASDTSMCPTEVAHPSESINLLGFFFSVWRSGLNMNEEFAVLENQE